MSLELHIWGPAFGLPSVDPLCLSAIAYCSECLPPDAWTLIACNDPTINPFNELPALKSGDLWFAGYDKIVRHLKEISNNDWDLDKELSTSQRADCFAFTSFLQSRAQPLLDLSTYVSSENYSTCTRPALGKILQWPDSWFVPHQLREKAKKRSEHLGLSGLDVNAAQDEKTEDETLTAQIPKTLRKTRYTVSSLLGRDARRNRFRLDAVTSDVLEPLADLVAEKQWIFGDRPTSIDCLVAGYLSLLAGPQDLPHAWIREAMQAKHVKLYEWTMSTRNAWFGEAETADQGSAVLSWREPEPRSWQDMTDALLCHCIDAVPVLRFATGRQEIIPDSIKYKPGHKEKQSHLSAEQHKQLMVNRIVGTSILTTIVAGVLFWNGLITIPRLRITPRPRHRDFGAAGAFLGLR